MKPRRSKRSWPPYPKSRRHPRIRSQRHRLSAPAGGCRGDAPARRQREATVNNVNSLIQRVAGTSLAEIEKLISELESLRDLLHAEGQRVQREFPAMPSSARPR